VVLSGVFKKGFSTDKTYFTLAARYVMLCYVMLCYVILCYVMLCYVMLCYVPAHFYVPCSVMMLTAVHVFL
jgi:hypothetical protein